MTKYAKKLSISIGGGSGAVSSSNRGQRSVGEKWRTKEKHEMIVRFSMTMAVVEAIGDLIYLKK